MDMKKRGVFMAFVTNENQQMNLTDHVFSLTEREKKYLERSWAKIFSEKVFPAIPEDRFSVLYSSNKASRPNTPVNIMIGALILREVMELNDSEIMQNLMFDIRYQYALHTTSFEEQPLSEKTLSRFRSRCLSYETETGENLIYDCISDLSEEISEFIEEAFGMPKMDSRMMAQNIRNLSFMELFYFAVVNLVKEMVQRGVDFPEDLQHYVEKEDHHRFMNVHDEDITERLNKVKEDAEILMESCDGAFDDTSEYQLMIRLLKESYSF